MLTICLLLYGGYGLAFITISPQLFCVFEIDKGKVERLKQFIENKSLHFIVSFSGWNVLAVLI